MPFHLFPSQHMLVVILAGSLTMDDYRRVMRDIERRLEEERLTGVLVRLDWFEGWHLGSGWRDPGIHSDRFARVARVAMVGGARWRPWMAGFRRPFREADTRFFESGRLGEAERWLGVVPGAGRRVGEA